MRQHHHRALLRCVVAAAAALACGTTSCAAYVVVVPPSVVPVVPTTTSSSRSTKIEARRHRAFDLGSSRLYAEAESGSKTSSSGSATASTPASTDAAETKETPESKLPVFLDPGTKGGAVVLSLILFTVPIIFYQIITNVFDIDELEAGKWVGGGFTVFATLAWVSTYIFRVATKDMTYAKQLKDYENAVIAKRLEELDQDELQALVEEVERDDF